MPGEALAGTRIHAEVKVKQGAGRESGKNEIKYVSYQARLL